MTTTVCPREDELLDALARGFVSPDLTAHLADCPSCRELRLVAGTLLDDHAAIDAPVPTAATTWWRMQVRRRQEAQAAARRSLVFGQAATLLIAIVLMLKLFGPDLIELREVFATVRVSTPLLTALAASLLLAPVAGYVAIRQK